ncbi:MAG: diaminopimelate decarboxylase [Clostridia bacterium]
MLFTKTSNINNNELYIGEISVKKLAKEFKTPLYIYDQNDIEDRVERYKKAFSSNRLKTKIAYASKALLTDYVAKLMKKLGLSIDAISIGDMYALIKAGFDMKNVYLHGNSKSFLELQYAIENDIGIIVIDNLQEVSKIKALADRFDKTVNVMFRINPDIYADTHKHLITAEKNSKFGIDKDNKELLTVIKEISNDNRLMFRGLHCHIGSQVNNSETFLSEVKSMITLAKKIEDELRITVEELNFGGGYAIKEKGSQEEPSNSELLEIIVKTVEKHVEELNLNLEQITIEPGRSLIGPSAITVYKVEATKKTAGDLNYIMVDGGMADNIRPSLYDAYYEAVVVNNVIPLDCQKSAIAGKCCESGDILIKECLMPKVTDDDYIAIFSTGAYNYSMASNYNGLGKPAIVFVKNNEYRLTTKRQEVEQIHQNDLQNKIM